MTPTENTWIEFYQEFADKLLPYKNDRFALIQKLLDSFPDIDLKFPKIDSEDPPTDVDPFTVFGMFNKGITRKNRLAIIEGFKNGFDVPAAIPRDFKGIPILNNMRSTFHWFGEREDDDIDNLWALFEAALNYADSDDAARRRDFIDKYDKVVSQKGIYWNITMGLFWIRPGTFVNLDAVNRWYLLLPDILPPEINQKFKRVLKSLPTGEEYLQICDILQEQIAEGQLGASSFPEFSLQAFVLADETNRQKGTEEEFESEQEELAAPTTPPDDTVGTQLRYWVYQPGEECKLWDHCYADGIMAVGRGSLGDLRQYDSKEAMRLKLKEIYESNSSFKNTVHMTWQFANEVKAGDIIFVKCGSSRIIGRGIVKSDYRFDPAQPEGYNHVRDVAWTHRGEWDIDFNLPFKALTDYTPYRESVNVIKACFGTGSLDEDDIEITYPPYTPEDFFDQVYMDQDKYDTIVRVLKNKKNIILQGAPGVGKTYVARRLAYSIMGEKNIERTMFVQFHQSYAYEDFVMGYRPTQDGFELKEGDFYRFCKEAEIDSEKPYFVIIDEINRGNLSKIFGELFMLLEADKRGIGIRLVYSGEDFTIPDNVYIIGTMNTADRSLALLDYALRRRFAFIDMKPVFQLESFKAYQSGLGFAPLDKLIRAVEQLNDAISEDASLGPDFVIGHSYFCGFDAAAPDEQTLLEIVDFEIVPLLKEYWFDEPEKVREWSQHLRGAVH